MKDLLHTITKKLLGLLTALSIKKHKTELIVITGWTGTSIVREMVYYALSEEYNVRRNTKEIWRDISVPLTILGYEDRRMNPFEWFLMLSRISLSLLLKRKHKHIVVLNFDSSDKNTAAYWTHYVRPYILVALKEKPNSKMLPIIRKTYNFNKDTLYIFNPLEIGSVFDEIENKITYSKNNADIVYTLNQDTALIKHKDHKAIIKIPKGFSYIGKYIPAVFCVGIAKNISFQNVTQNLSHFSFLPDQLQKLKKHLKDFIRTDE